MDAAIFVATPDEFQFAWTQRKTALLARWQKAPEFKEFWSGTLAGEEFSASALAKLRKAKPEDVSDTQFCRLCPALNGWVNDLRQVPIVVPTPAQQNRFSELAERAMEAKQCEFANQPPAQTLAAFCRAAKDALVVGAPAYLRPDAQEQLLATPESCLAVIERAVNWESEKLYGVEGLGPFGEF